MEGEGLRLKAYPDPKTKARPYTNGYGCTRKKDGSLWELGEEIRPSEAIELLFYWLKAEYLPAIKAIPAYPFLNVNQRAALLSFAWNLGAYFYGDLDHFQTITTKLKSHDFDGVPESLFLYIDKGSAVEQGLINRRKKEAELWRKSLITVL